MAEVKGRSIETISGNFLDVSDPNPDDIELVDIAWATSRIARFAGHTVTEIPYVVGQHQIFVSNMLWETTAKKAEDKTLALFGLFHDAAEAWIGDIPSPIKHIPEFKKYVDRIEDTLLKLVFDKFIGRQPTEEEWVIVKYFDKKAQFIEAYSFMPSRGLGWTDKEKYAISLIDIQTFPVPQAPIQVFQNFMTQYEWLKSKD